MATSSNPANYLDASNYYSNTDFATPKNGTTNDGCGTSFTTASDPKNINVKQELSGHLTKVCSVNDQKDTLYKLMTSDGKSFTMDEDGSIIFTTAKREDDHNSGRFDVRAQGHARLKIGEALLIEVENKNNAISGKSGDSTTAKAFSLIVYGNIDIEARDGELNVKGKNVTINATNELTLQAGSKISLLSGEGTGGNASVSTSSSSQSADPEYGGLVEIKCGDLAMDSQSIRQQSAMDYKVVSHDGATISSQPLANYGFQSPGSFTLDIAGDMYEKIGGLKRTEILNTAKGLTTLFPGQSDAYLITTPKVDGDSVAIVAEAGGMYFNTTKGDIALGTQAGDWIVYGKGGAVAALGTQRKLSDGTTLNSGAYFTAGGGKEMYIGGPQTKKIKMGVNSDLTKGDLASGITVSTDKIEIKNTSGIYLN